MALKELRLSTLACTGDGGVAASLRRGSAMIAEAAHNHPDLICLPELFAWTSLSGARKRRAAEPIDGKFSRAMAQLAARSGTNVLSPLLERHRNRIYNSMVWCNRDGKTAGIYRKAFPTDYEMEEGTSPGPLDFKVFETEFGRIGCCICFDLNFREMIERLAEQNCKLVIVPTMFDGITLMQAWAKLYRMYFVSVAAQPYGSVVSPLGETLVAPWRHAAIHQVTLNLDFLVLHTDRNAAKFRAIKAKYNAAVEIQSFDLQSCALLTSRHRHRTAYQIAAEFGLEAEEHYYLRSAKIAENKRAPSPEGLT